MRRPAVIQLLIAALISAVAAGDEPLPEIPPALQAEFDALDKAAAEPADALPEPALTEGFEIGEALADPVRVDIGVVSLLARMGLALTDAEVRGLIAMGREDLLAGRAKGRPPWSFRDLHAAVKPLLPALSLEDMAAKFSEAYAAAPESLVPQVFQGMPIEPATPLTRVQLWLLLVDGFAPPTAAPSVAQLGGAGLAPSGGPAWGTASLTLPQIPSPDPTLDLQDWQYLLSRLPLLAYDVPFDVLPFFGQSHEGHGGPGAPANVDIRIAFRPAPVMSPVTGRTVLRIRTPDLGNRMVWWEIRDLAKLQRHGSLNRQPSVPIQTDSMGQARITFSPKKEDADGQGLLMEEVASVHARISQWDLLTTQYDLLPLYRGLLFGDRVTQGLLSVGWHSENAIRVSLENSYHATIDFGFLGRGSRTGKDVAKGVLELQPDGSYAGEMDARVIATQEITSQIGPSCPRRRYDRSQRLAVTGRAVPGFNSRVQTITQISGTSRVLGYLALEFKAASWPTGGTARCVDLIYRDPEPIPFIPLNDARWTIPQGSYAIAFPESGTLTYRDITRAAPDYSVWKVEVERGGTSP